MTKKQYLIKGYATRDNGEVLYGIFDSETKSPYYIGALSYDELNKIGNKLNELSDTVGQLKEQNKELQGKYDKQLWLYNGLGCEYDALEREKERYKRLSEIRSEEINNRILTIKEFIDDCSDEEVKNVLKDLFYSEVNEYDLSKENRKLQKENEQLKSEISEQGTQIDFLKDENQHMKTVLNENEQLKKELDLFKPIIFESDGEPVTLYKKGDVE